jgi:hypothetical protein
MVCEYCNFIAKNQQALSAHLRGCTVKKNMIEKKEGDIAELNTSIIIQTPVEIKKKNLPKKIFTPSHI